MGQVQLEMILGMRRELMQMEESLAVALSKGARVEPGIHSAELVPERRRNTSRELIMKLVVLVIFFATLPAVCSRAGAFEDVNGDGKIDVQDFLEGGNAPASPSEKREWNIKA